MPMHRFRKEYYQAGRVLMFTGGLSSAGIILGYAAELSLKAALIEAGFPKLPKKKNILYGHAIKRLFDECQKRGIFQGVQVSKDFLKYIEDWLNRRYPIQQQALSARLSAENLAESFDWAYLDAYDDFLLQLDDDIASQTNDAWRVSVGVRSAVEAETFTGAAFFHCNTAAYLRAGNYLNVLAKHDPGNRICIDMLRNFQQRLWKSRGIQNTLAALRKSVSMSDHPASLFVYPQAGRAHRAITYSNMAASKP